MADTRKAYIALCGSDHLTITTPLFHKTLNLSDKTIKAVDLISLRTFEDTYVARQKSDFIIIITYKLDSKHLDFSVDVYAKTEPAEDLRHIGALEQREQVFKINIIPDKNKVYFQYLEHVDDVL